MRHPWIKNRKELLKYSGCNKKGIFDQIPIYGEDDNNYN